jgi:predicted lipoprotein with Yx(FWY)xxD motif
MSRIEDAVIRGTRWVAPLGAGLVALALATVAVAALAKPATVTTHQTKRGKVLAAANGHSLYLFTADVHSKSTCYGSCAATWKPLLTSGRPVAAKNSGVNASLLGTTRRTDHTVQVTYRGHPLYTFVRDKSAGQINGEGANQFHGHWYLVNTSGNAIKPKSGGGGGVCNPLCQGY